VKLNIKPPEFDLVDEGIGLPISGCFDALIFIIIILGFVYYG